MLTAGVGQYSNAPQNKRLLWYVLAESFVTCELAACLCQCIASMAEIAFPYITNLTWFWSGKVAHVLASAQLG